MNYRTVAQLNEDVRDWAVGLPRDIDVIAGVPRSGLLAATLLALHRDLPMTDVDGLVHGRIFAAGTRRDVRPDVLTTRRKVLVVDDSIFSGSQLKLVREAVEAARLPHEVLYSAVYVAPGAQPLIDFHYEVVRMPRCFEWNILHHSWLLARSCMDVDGVLCRDPGEEENDDGPNYLRFLADVEPAYMPGCRVGWLVTSRLEKYRRETERWLSAHGVDYGGLVMMQYADKASRQAAGAYASFKAGVYRETGAALFVESSPRLAAEIARLSGKHVFCMETREMIVPGLPARVRYAAQDLPRRLRLVLARARRA